MSLFSRFKIGNERYPALTGIRALGATAVFFAHLPFAVGVPLSVDVLTLFFVLSGYLIVYLYYQDERVATGRFYHYFVNRFARIYPVYFLLVTLAILYRHDFSAGFLVKNYTLTHALFDDHSARAIDPSWSLTVEECFYLLAPLIMLLIRRFGFLISLLFGCVLLGMALIISTVHTRFLFLNTPSFIFSTTFFGHFFEFYCGAFLALVILRREKRGAVDRAGGKFTWWGVFGVLVSFAAGESSRWFDSSVGHPIYIAINNFILPLPVTLLYFGLITENTRLSRFLSGKLLGLLGRTSYSFYLVHMLVIECIAIPYVLPLLPGYYNVYVILIYLLTQLIALLLFALYEEPLNIFIRRRFKERRNTTMLSINRSL
jgi:peptidoglycan/LPS O-acetylase OafA/YrhL